MPSPSVDKYGSNMFLKQRNDFVTHTVVRGFSSSFLKITSSLVRQGDWVTSEALCDC